MIKAICLDLDGVLIDSNGWHAQAFERALSEHGFDVRVPSGYSSKSVFKGVPSELQGPITKAKWTYAHRLMYRYAEPNIVHQHALAALKVDGYRLLITSSSISSFVMGAMWKTGIAKYIDGVLAGDMVSKRKPDPEVYQKALVSLRHKGDEVLAVEDSDSGVRAAEGAGLHVLRVNGVMGLSYQSVTGRIGEIDFAEHRDPGIGPREEICGRGVRAA